MTHTIDASNQSLGRIATKAAILLRGKADPAFKPYVIPSDKVVIKNISKINFMGSKKSSKIYYHYSGYPGGMSSTTLDDLWRKNPQEVVRKAVFGMLPKNRQRGIIINNLVIE